MSNEIINKISPQEKKNLEEIAEKLFEEAKLTSDGIDNLEKYDLVIRNLRRELKKASTNPDNFHYLTHMLRVKCQRLISESGLEATLPNMPERFIEDPSFRTRDFFKNGCRFYDWVDAYKARMSVASLKHIEEPEEFLYLGVFNAILLGGLYSKRKIDMVVNQLLTQQKPLKSINYKPYIEFDTLVSAGLYNVDEDGEAINRQRWYVDPVSLALFHKYLRLRGLEKPEEQVSRGAVFAGLKKYIIGSLKSDISSLQNVIDGAIYVSNSKAKYVSNSKTNDVSNSEINLDISEILFYVAREDHETYAVDEASLKGLYGIKQPNMVSDMPLPLEDQQFEKELETSIKDFPKIGNFYGGILRAINKVQGTNNKAEFQKLLEKVKANNSHLSNTMLIFADWLSHISSYLELSTVKTYFHYLAPLWLPEMIMFEFEKMTNGDYLMAYENMIERIEKPTTLNIKIGQIQSIHKFGVKSKFYNLPDIEDFGRLDHYRTSKKSRVRTQLIDHKTLKAALLDLLNGSSLSRDQKMILRIMIIAFRTGMRRGEISKLRIQDIEPEGQWWVQIVNNKYGKNKSKSSARDLPIKTLLHDDEFADFEAFYHSRCSEVSKDQLLFGCGSHNFRLADGYVTAFSQVVLRKASGQSGVVLHSLRHTAANMMHAVIEENYVLAKQISGFNDVKLKEIRRSIVGPDHVHISKYWELASFMGHSSPLMSFSSYLHLTDLIIYDKILASGFFVTKVAISYLATDDKGVSYPVSRIKEDNKQVLLKHMINKNKDLYEFALTTPPAAYTREYEFPELKDRIREGQGYDDVEIRNRLKDYQESMEVDDICEKYGFDQLDLETYIGRANPLFTALTGKSSSGNNGAKHYRAQCQDYSEDLPKERWVVPKLPRGLKCRSEAAGAIKKLIPLAKENKGDDDVSRWARMTFKASNYRHSYLQIKSPEDLKFITSSFNRVFDQRRWYAEVRLKDISKNNPKRKTWEKAMPDKGQIEFIAKDNEDQGNGSAQLFYQRKDFKSWLKGRNKGKDKKDQWNQISSDQLKYISQMLLIVLGG